MKTDSLFKDGIVAYPWIKTEMDYVRELGNNMCMLDHTSENSVL